MPDQEIDEEFISSLKARDKRWEDVDTAIKLERELRDSIAIRMVLEVLQEEAEKALELLVYCDPTDIKQITALQARIQRAKIMGNTLESIRHRGRVAEAMLSDENSLQLDE